MKKTGGRKSRDTLPLNHRYEGYTHRNGCFKRLTLRCGHLNVLILIYCSIFKGIKSQIWLFKETIYCENILKGQCYPGLFYIFVILYQIAMIFQNSLVTE